MVSRREFLRGRFSATAPTLRPPWAIAEPAFVDTCTRCGACAPVCPTSIISIQNGFPEVDFGRGECTFCGECVKACAPRALQNGESQTAPWPIKARIGRTCLSVRGVECRVCGDYCESGALRFRPRLGGPPVPEVDSGDCTGCGACIAPCPENAITAA